MIPFCFASILHTLLRYHSAGMMTTTRAKTPSNQNRASKPVFICDDKFHDVKSTLRSRGWTQNPIATSPCFDLKWRNYRNINWRLLRPSQVRSSGVLLVQRVLDDAVYTRGTYLYQRGWMSDSNLSFVLVFLPLSPFTPDCQSPLQCPPSFHQNPPDSPPP